MRIAGLRCIYDIAATDVDAVYLVAGSIGENASAVRFRIGQVYLALSLKQTSVLDTFKAKFGARSPGLHKRIQEALEPAARG
ncbi:MAG: hypothetical protein QM770_00855 [Tepidisphaeraceae bacterium]